MYLYFLLWKFPSITDYTFVLNGFVISRSQLITKRQWSITRQKIDDLILVSEGSQIYSFNQGITVDYLVVIKKKKTFTNQAWINWFWKDDFHMINFLTKYLGSKSCCKKDLCWSFLIFCLLLDITRGIATAISLKINVCPFHNVT